MYKNTNFILIHLNTGKKTTVQTNSEGKLLLNLSNGKYAIRETYKDCSFEEFQRNNIQSYSNDLAPNRDEDCYKNWWKSNLGEFNISNANTLIDLHFQTKSGCYTGLNPCLYYIGPAHP